MLLGEVRKIMEINEKIFQLRKKNNFSQEELAEKIGVARQTISKWELGETSPDLKQAKELARIFKVSLDELANNDVKDVMVEKISNTERLAGIIIKILKVSGIIFIIMLVLEMIAFAIFTSSSSFKQAESSALVVCELKDKDYEIEFGTDKYFKCNNCSEKMTKEIKKLANFEDIEGSINRVEDYFLENGGSCE